MYDPEDPFFYWHHRQNFEVKLLSVSHFLRDGSLGRGCAEMRSGTHSKALGVLQSLPGRRVGFPGKGRSGETMNLASALIFRVDYG